jgi:hypothetical protein
MPAQGNSPSLYHKLTSSSKAVQLPQWLLIASICLIGMLRIFIFNAAFPIFNNVDEQSHFDTIVKYARGYAPRSGANALDSESVRLIAAYSTLEYLNQPGNLPGGKIPVPIWRLPPELKPIYINFVTSIWIHFKNTESSSPPLYYFVLGIWYNLGKFLGFSGLLLLYWLRFSNVPLFGLLIVSAYVLCRAVFNTKPYLYIGVPFLLALFPQDLFYSLNSDVPSALLFVVSITILFILYQRQRGCFLYCIAGIAIGATVLIKLTNIFIAVPVLFFSFLLLQRARDKHRLGSETLHLALMLLIASLPVFLWMVWNLHAFNDLTATSEKLAILGWTRKSFSELCIHPIFTLRGAWFFISKLIGRFWCGEMLWGGQPLTWSVSDAFYVYSSILLLSVAGINAFAKRRLDGFGAVMSAINFACIIAGIIILAFLSISFNFHDDSWYPSLGKPYFTSGRLISGALVPFLCLYVEGVAIIVFRISRLIRRKINPLVVLGILCASIMICEICIKAPVFASNYNFFHGL